MASKKHAPPPSPAPVSEAELQRQHERWLAFYATIKSVSVATVWAVAAVGFAYVTFYLPILVAHGESTAITVTQQFFGDIHADVAIAYGLGVSGAAYGLWERRKRLKELGEKDTRIKDLENKIDPNSTQPQPSPGTPVPQGQPAPGPGKP